MEMVFSRGGGMMVDRRWSRWGKRRVKCHGVG